MALEEVMKKVNKDARKQKLLNVRTNATKIPSKAPLKFTLPLLYPYRAIITGIKQDASQRPGDITTGSEKNNYQKVL